MNKTAMKNFAVWARKKLREDITYKAGLLGVSEKGIAEPLPEPSYESSGAVSPFSVETPSFFYTHIQH